MKVKEDILAIISNLEFDGCNARITDQLDRKTYVAVNKVLVAAGGKWNRKAKAHVFPQDAASTLDHIITTGEVTTHREIGFFPTPTSLAKQLVSMAHIKEGAMVLEPSAGTGSIVSALLEVGAFVSIVERDVEMRAALQNLEHTALYFAADDFLDIPPKDMQDAVVMNPPFTKSGKGDALDHVRHAFAFLKEGGVLVSVLPSSVEWRQDKRYREFRAWYEEFGGEVTSLPALSFKPSGTNVNTLVLRMRKGSA